MHSLAVHIFFYFDVLELAFKSQRRKENIQIINF